MLGNHAQHIAWLNRIDTIMTVDRWRRLMRCARFGTATQANRIQVQIHFHFGDAPLLPAPNKEHKVRRGCGKAHGIAADATWLGTALDWPKINRSPVGNMVPVGVVAVIVTPLCLKTVGIIFVASPAQNALDRQLITLPGLQPANPLIDPSVAVVVSGVDALAVDLNQLGMATFRNHRTPLVIIETIVGRAPIGKVTPALAHMANRGWVEALLEAAVVDQFFARAGTTTWCSRRRGRGGLDWCWLTRNRLHGRLIRGRANRAALTPTRFVTTVMLIRSRASQRNRVKVDIDLFTRHTPLFPNAYINGEVIILSHNLGGIAAKATR